MGQYSMGQLSGRSIRTFVLRQGRLTEGQQRSLDEHWSVIGIDVTAGDVKPEKAGLDSKPADRMRSDSQDALVRDDSLDVDQIDLKQHFELPAPIWMEIGIGNGEALVHLSLIHI